MVAIGFEYYYWYGLVMIAEWAIYSRYVWLCAHQRTMRHPLFWAALFCWLVLALELVRVNYILHGWLLPLPKYWFWWLLEHVPFSVVAYEIYKRWVHKVLLVLWNL